LSIYLKKIQILNILFHYEFKIFGNVEFRWFIVMCANVEFRWFIVMWNSLEINSILSFISIQKFLKPTIIFTIRNVKLS